MVSHVEMCIVEVFSTFPHVAVGSQAVLHRVLRAIRSNERVRVHRHGPAALLARRAAYADGGAGAPVPTLRGSGET